MRTVFPAIWTTKLAWPAHATLTPVCAAFPREPSSGGREMGRLHGAWVAANQAASRQAARRDGIPGWARSLNRLMEPYGAP
ncbi:MAG: hypothetical protein ACYDBQ_06690 [Thermoplasmatota archaeon]